MEDGNDFLAWVWQVIESGDTIFQPNEMSNNVPKLKATMHWAKATRSVQRAIMQDSQLLVLKFMAKKAIP